MPPALANVMVHLVFSTNNRQLWLADLKDRDELHTYVATVLTTLDCPSIIVNGTADLVRALCRSARNSAIRRRVG